MGSKPGKTNHLDLPQDIHRLNTNPQRVLAFKRIPNFRDLGGYAAAGGKQVKWGVLYRSGHLGKMRRGDLKHFKMLKIHTLIDFRSNNERERTPNRLPDSAPTQTILLPIEDLPRSEMSQELRAAAKSKDLQSFDPSEKMIGLYRRLAVESVGQYQQFIHSILAAQGRPVLWHCMSGKDRTGFAAAILLRLLGVDPDIVLEDYLLSDQYADRRNLFIGTIRVFKGKEFSDLIQTFFRVQEGWMRAAFQSIDEHWGSFEQYSREALSLSEQQISQLQQTLLEA